jgi:hypothetical protein
MPIQQGRHPPGQPARQSAPENPPPDTARLQTFALNAAAGRTPGQPARRQRSGNHFSINVHSSTTPSSSVIGASRTARYPHDSYNVPALRMATSWNR